MKEKSLGTALWGWSVDADEAFKILDCFYGEGYRFLDTANNYPLNGNAINYRKAQLFVSDWCKVHGVNDLKITYKIGSLSNTNTPLNNLSSSFLLEQMSLLQEIFSDNLDCLMLHWDNRDDLKEVEETLKIIDYLKNQNINFGVSGIKNPFLYSSLLREKKLENLNIQIKHNFILSKIDHYSELFNLTPKFWAYGIAVSGLKLPDEKYTGKNYVTLARGKDYHKDIYTEKISSAIKKCIDINPRIKSMYHLAIVFSEFSRMLEGYLIAPSTVEQMRDINNFLSNFDHEDFDLSPVMNFN